MKFIQHTKLIKATSHREYVIQEYRDEKGRLLHYSFVREKGQAQIESERFYERQKMKQFIEAHI